MVKLGLYGSFARNEGTENSDIDIIVEFKPNTEDLLDKKAKIKNLIGVNSIERLIYAEKNTSNLILGPKSLNQASMSEKDKANLLAIFDSCSKIQKFTEEIWDADALFTDEKHLMPF